MAKIIKRKIKKNTSKRKVQKGFFNKFNLTESYTSLIMGAIVVLIAGILLIFLAKGNKSVQTSSVKEGPSANTEAQKSDTSSTYTVNVGDDLWSISQNIYHDGYKWIEIAKANNLENPGLIHAGNKLIIPTAEPSIDQKSTETKSEISINSNSVIKNNSITGDTYTIKPGDNLWDIAVRAYGDGFKWPEIAKTNNLTNPDLIFSDNVLKIPR